MEVEALSSGAFLCGRVRCCHSCCQRRAGIILKGLVSSGSSMAARFTYRMETSMGSPFECRQDLIDQQLEAAHPREVDAVEFEPSHAQFYERTHLFDNLLRRPHEAEVLRSWVGAEKITSKRFGFGLGW